MPIDKDDDPKLQKLDAELKAARNEYEKDYNPKPDANEEGMNIGARAGTELVGAIIGGGLIGYAIDSYFDTSPIFLISCFLLGVATGFYNIYKITLNIGTSVGFKGLKNPSKNGKQSSNYKPSDYDDEEDY